MFLKKTESMSHQDTRHQENQCGGFRSGMPLKGIERFSRLLPCFTVVSWWQISLLKSRQGSRSRLEHFSLSACFFCRRPAASASAFSALSLAAGFSRIRGCGLLQSIPEGGLLLQCLFVQCLLHPLSPPFVSRVGRKDLPILPIRNGDKNGNDDRGHLCSEVYSPDKQSQAAARFRW